MFQIKNQSVFEEKSDSYVWTCNCVSVAGAGIALEFKKRYPKMYQDYKIKCQEGKIKPGDCYVYVDDGKYLLGLAVKNDWKYWSCKEWIESSIRSMKLILLEKDIKSVNLPLIGGMNGRRGPNGRIPNMEPPPEREDLKRLIREHLEIFSNKFDIDIKLCIPDGTPMKKPELDLTKFFGV